MIVRLASPACSDEQNEMKDPRNTISASSLTIHTGTYAMTRAKELAAICNFCSDMILGLHLHESE